VAFPTKGYRFDPINVNSFQLMIIQMKIDRFNLKHGPQESTVITIRQRCPLKKIP
jgi:hypothetical protein